MIAHVATCRSLIARDIMALVSLVAFAFALRPAGRMVSTAASRTSADRNGRLRTGPPVGKLAPDDSKSHKPFEATADAVQKFVIIDGHALTYRMHFALQQTAMATAASDSGTTAVEAGGTTESLIR